MARRAFTITAAALTATTALLLTGCGGDDSSDDIEGADAGSSSPSTSAAASTPAGVESPEITIPSSFKLTFADWKSDDPEKQAVLDDGREQLRAGYAAIIENDLDSEALAFYDTKAGLSQDQEWIRSYTDKNLTVVGELPVYDPEAELFGENTKAIRGELGYDEQQIDALFADGVINWPQPDYPWTI